MVKECRLLFLSMLMVLAAIVTTAAVNPYSVVTTRQYDEAKRQSTQLPPDQPQPISPTPTKFVNWSEFPTPKPAEGIYIPIYSGGRGGVDGPINLEAKNTSGESGGSGSGTTISRITYIDVYKTVFNNPTAKDALIYFLKENLTNAYNSLFKLFNSTNNVFWKWTLPEDTDAAKNDENSIISMRKQVWNVSATIAALLFPLTLLVSILTTIQKGAGAELGFASVREALINWMVAIGVAVSSYWWLDVVGNLTDGVARAVFDNMNFNVYKDAIFSAAMFLETIKNPSMGTEVSIGDVASLIYLVFMIIMLICLGIAAFLALISREVILFVMIFLTPLSGVLINLGPLRFLKWYWLQGLTIGFLLLPVNAILFTTVFNSQELILKASDDYHVFVGIIFCIGLMSIALALNKAFGEAVMGSVVQVGKYAWGATQATIGAIVMVAAAVVTSGVSLGATTAFGATEATATSTALSSTTPQQAKSLFDAYKSAQGARNLSNSLGHVLGNSGNPILRGAGIGMQTGTAINQYNDTRGEQGADMMGAWNAHFGEQFLGEENMPGMEEAGSAVAGFASMYPDDRSGALLSNLDVSRNIMDVGQREFGFGYGQILKDGFLFPKTGLLSQEGVRKTGQDFFQSYALQKTYGTQPGKSMMGLHNSLPRAGYVTRYTPDSPGVHPRDLGVSSIMMAKDNFLLADPQLIKDTTLMVYAKRTTGENYNQITGAQNGRDVKGWLAESASGLVSSPDPALSNFARDIQNRYR